MHQSPKRVSEDFDGELNLRGSPFKRHGYYRCQLNNIVGCHKYGIQLCKDEGRMTPKLFLTWRYIVKRKHFNQKRYNYTKENPYIKISSQG